MMRALFCHDFHFVAHDGEVYTTPQFGYDHWRARYPLFDHITAVGRGETGDPPPGTVRSSGPGLAFIPAPNIAGLRGLASRREAASILKAAMADVDLVVSRLPSELGLLACGLADRHGYRYAVEVVANAWDVLWNYGSLQARLYAPVMTLRMRQTVRRAPAAIYSSERFLQRVYPCNGLTAGVSSVELPPLDHAVLDRRLERIARSCWTVVFGLIGDFLNRSKGVHTAIDALAGIAHRLPAFELRVLGEGEPRELQRQAQRAGIGGRVRFCGVLPSEQVLAWLDGIDVYLQPSLQEGHGRALREAMSRACPVLGSTAGGIREILPDEYLHRRGDARQLGETIMRLVTDRQWMATSARWSFATAGKYDADTLRRARASFWEAVRDQAAYG